MSYDIIYTLVRGDETFNIGVEHSVTFYDPGNTYGLPEDCEPPSGGEIATMTITHADRPFEVTDDERAAIEKHIYETHDYGDVGYQGPEDW